MKFLLILTMAAAGLIASDATGTWDGTFTPDGDEAGPAHLVLKQDGVKVTGTAGPTKDKQHEIHNGKTENGKITFEVVENDGTMKFVLTQDGDEIKGDVARQHDGQVQTAKLVVKRSN